MKNIYTVHKNYQWADHEDWQHDIEDKIVSYHSTKENAEKAILQYLHNDLMKVERQLEKDSSLYAYYLRCKEEFAQNQTLFEVGTNHEEIKCSIYFTGFVQLED